MHSLDLFARTQLHKLEGQGLRRFRAETDRGSAPAVLRDGRPVISFSCNDYLGLSAHPAVVAAAHAALDRHGLGAGASRMITGDHPLYPRLEARLAEVKGTESALVFGSGYLANLAIIQALAGEGDLILIDELAHNSMIAGTRLSRARTLIFRHNDVEDCRRLMVAERGKARHCLILTEGVFSMDGDRAPVAALAALGGETDSWLLTDDAHALGVIDPVDAPVPLKMGTLSKALGAYGGYVCATRNVTDFLRNRGHSFIFTTGLPPAVIAGALAALEIIAADPALVALPLARARRFTGRLGLKPAESAVVPVILGAERRTVEASKALLDRGFAVVAIRPPTVPPGTSRLRVAFSARHSEADVDALAAAIEDLGLMG